VLSGFRKMEVESEIRIKFAGEVVGITHFIEGENHGKG
jgi:hypothetical protein